MSGELVKVKDRRPGARPSARVRRRWSVTGQGIRGGSVVVLQHGDHAPAGLLLEVLSARGSDPAVVRVDEGEALPDPAAYDHAVLLCGAGPELNAPWLERELEWVAAADRAGTALFAVGTGAHTLALALGGDSAPSGRAQRGWINVLSADPSVLPDGPWFAWQDRVLRLPERAELLASSALGAQAFRLGRHIGVQFHPEITPELIRQWIPRSPQLLDSQGIQEATERDFPLAAPAARKLFASFLDASAA